MKSCTEPFAYGVERFEPKRAAGDDAVKRAIFQDARGLGRPLALHLVHLGRIVHTGDVDACRARTTSASVPRIGPEVITGEQMRMRFRAEAIERDIACTSFSAAARTEVRPHARAVGERRASAVEMRPEVATTGLLPELLEVLRVVGRELGRRDGER